MIAFGENDEADKSTDYLSPFFSSGYAKKDLRLGPKANTKVNSKWGVKTLGGKEQGVL